jgi:hypothetical protein
VSSGEDAKQGRLNPAALPAEAAARLLTAAGGVRVDVEQLRADIDAGAPTNADGTINLMHYAAWLVQQMARDAKGGAPGVN